VKTRTTYLQSPPLEQHMRDMRRGFAVVGVFVTIFWLTVGFGVWAALR
jgi:hypothetical protein